MTIPAEENVLLDVSPPPLASLRIVGRPTFGDRDLELSTDNSARELRFIAANPVYLEDPDPVKDGDKSAVFLDEDGTVSGVAGAYVVANSPHLVTDRCQSRADWNAHICRERYIQLHLWSDSKEAVAPLGLRRDDGAAVQLVGTGGKTENVSTSLVTGRQYTIRYADGTPFRPRIRLSGVRDGERVQLAVPYPPAQLTAWGDYDKSRPLTAAGSLAEMEGSGGAAYYNTAAGTLHVRILSREGRHQPTLFIAPK